MKGLEVVRLAAYMNGAFADSVDHFPVVVDDDRVTAFLSFN
jgi:hypothetical protein